MLLHPNTPPCYITNLESTVVVSMILFLLVMCFAVLSYFCDFLEVQSDGADESGRLERGVLAEI